MQIIVRILLIILVLNYCVPVTSVTFTPPVSDRVTVTPGGSQVYTCVTGSCRPSARIDWYKNGVNVTTQAGSVSSDGNKFVTTSSLTLTGARGDSPATVQCRTSNRDGMAAVQSGTKTFVVQWAPDGPPMLSGYTDLTMLYPNDELSLLCRQPGGNPQPTLTWIGVCGGIPATYDSSGSEAASEITITVTKEYNQATCVCVSTHPQPQTPDRTHVTFTVHYAPDKDPVITGYTEGQILYEGSPDLSLTCTQEGGNPLATITWNCVGQSGTYVGVSTTQTTSTVQVPRDRSINRKPCTCSARSPDTNITFEESASVIFTIYYAPSASQLPNITGYTSGEVLYEGDPAKSVQCHQIGGFPLATLTWDCFGLSGTKTSTESESASRIQLSSNSNYNDRNCSCTATHPDNNVVYRRSVDVTVTVYYPPSIPNILQTPTHPWLAGDSGTLMCSYSEGFPAPARIEWSRDGNLQTGQSTNSVNLTPLTSDDNQAGYACRVSNKFTDTKHTSQTSPNSNLNVEYKPVMTLTPTHLTVFEGQTAQVTCEAMGNPTPTLQWQRGGLSVHTGPGTSLTLTRSDIDRSATDHYTCRAEGMSSVQGRQLVTERISSILVQFPPDVKVVVPGLTVEEGDTNVRLMCQTTGEPNTLTSQSWIQTIDQSFITDHFTYETATQDTIVLTEAALDDTGTYTCSVSNGIADRQGQTIQSNSSVLNVVVAAKFNSSGQNHNFYSRLHESFTVKIPFYSNPPVTFVADIEWTQLTTGDQIVTSGDTTFNLHNGEVIYLLAKGRTVMFSGQAATMTIRSFDRSMAGNYTVTVYNGSRRRQSTTTFSISPSGNPNTPTCFRVIDYTPSSITVEWTKGSNGGHAQTFVIMYGTIGRSSIQTVSVLEQAQSTYTKEITDLSPNTRYQLNLYAYNEVGNSSLSSVVDIIGKTQQHLQETTSSPNATYIALIVIGWLMAAITSSVLIACLIYRRKQNGKRTHDSRKDKSDGVGSQSSTREQGNSNDGSHYDDLNLEEREPQSSYELIGGNTAAERIPTEDRMMYESLGTRNNAAVYEELKEPSRRIYENTVIR